MSRVYAPIMRAKAGEMDALESTSLSGVHPILVVGRTIGAMRAATGQQSLRKLQSVLLLGRVDLLPLASMGSESDAVEFATWACEQIEKGADIGIALPSSCPLQVVRWLKPAFEAGAHRVMWLRLDDEQESICSFDQGVLDRAAKLHDRLHRWGALEPSDVRVVADCRSMVSGAAAYGSIALAQEVAVLPWQSFALVAGSFPAYGSRPDAESVHLIRRSDWLLLEQHAATFRDADLGDYGPMAPDIFEDPKERRSRAAKIVVAQPTHWLFSYMKSSDPPRFVEAAQALYAHVDWRNVIPSELRTRVVGTANRMVGTSAGSATGWVKPVWVHHIQQTLIQAAAIP